MIEVMKKITVLLPTSALDSFLSALRKEGVLHIKHIKAPSAEDMGVNEEAMLKIDEAATILFNYSDKYAAANNKINADTDIDTDEERYKAKTIIDAFYEKENLEGNLSILDASREWFGKWGKVDVEDITFLRSKGVNVKLYEIGKSEYKKIKDKYNLKVIKEYKKTVCVMIIALAGDGIPGLTEVKPPDLGFDGWIKKEEEIKRKIKELETFLKSKASWLGNFVKLKGILEKRKEFLTVKAGMLNEGAFSCVRGFSPENHAEKVIKLSKIYGAGYLIENPDSPEETPTSIKNPKWIEIINPVLNFMNTVPGYNEFDISLVFLAFLSLFFAMLVGDAGYGLILATLTFLARRKFKNVPPQPFFLMYLFSVGTIIWGAMTGSWFGYEEIAKTKILSGLVVDRINAFVDANQTFIMFMCFIIGAAHLTIAHLIRAARHMNSLVCLAEFGWIAIIWGMFYLAGTLVISRPFPSFGGALIGIGSLIVLIFADFQKNIFKGMLNTLTNLPLSVISAFSDVVSYLRLFAVGYASSVVASSFNGMASSSGINGIIGGLVAALILFFGHTLNIVLSLMAVVVHGVRLNMLEFSGHLGMQWSGKAYKPFTE